MSMDITWLPGFSFFVMNEYEHRSITKARSMPSRSFDSSNLTSFCRVSLLLLEREFDQSRSYLVIYALD